jgi:hypothetical protein
MWDSVLGIENFRARIEFDLHGGPVLDNAIALYYTPAKGAVNDLGTGPEPVRYFIGINRTRKLHVAVMPNERTSPVSICHVDSGGDGDCRVRV